MLDEAMGVSDGLLDAVEELDGLADAVSNLYWTNRPVKARKAANLIGRTFRERARHRAASARTIQRASRARASVKEEAVRRMQRAFRRRWKRRQEVTILAPSYDRPGFRWLQSQMDVQEDAHSSVTSAIGRPGVSPRSSKRWLQGQHDRMMQRSASIAIGAEGERLPPLPSMSRLQYRPSRVLVAPPIGMPPGYFTQLASLGTPLEPPASSFGSADSEEQVAKDIDDHLTTV